MRSLTGVYSQISDVFKQHIGSDAVSKLASSISNKKVIVISGEMYTGKDTQIKRLLEHISGEMTSAGDIFRSHAKELGITPGQLGAYLKNHSPLAALFESLIDYQICEKIAQGSSENEYMVVQGRLAVWMAQYVRSLGHKNIKTVIFTCAPRDQVLRMVNREAPGVERNKVAPFLLPSYSHIGEAIPHLEKSGLIPTSVLDKLKIEVRRDIDNIDRLLEVYGTDLRRTDIADNVINTTPLTPDEVYKSLLACLGSFIRPMRP